ncbi:phenylalanine--tRNA ligase subunit alpha [Alicyclobacillus contaminans]|uniref:phenylalanine--tRNA ligase subunit alpha n=1 Tax=Alicyclobacillus contaminans TaxID=392016 RepID=UPI000478F0E5|nr:phenylalanine--tRNA ligase subunit alpha [Alicyclobacillus contaminans]
MTDWIASLQSLRDRALGELADAQDMRQLDEWRVQYLGKKSDLTQISRQMGQLPAEERPVLGEHVNQVRSVLQDALTKKQEALHAAELERRFAAETIDVTAPGRRKPRGSMHPLTQIIEEIVEIFVAMGYEVAEGPEVETDEYNFEKLNLPKHHPARDMQDTFYLTESLLLRTQTSPMQVRTMERMRPNVPVKVIAPGKVYRRDEDDATHSHMFHQIEGLVVGEGIRMSDLKGTLELFARSVFGADQTVRLRPSFFPFTEPSAELDIRCTNCGGSGCRMCKDTGWLEILGCGMVHPRVLDGAGYDSRRFSGFAFGMGPERIAMLKYGIEDIRLLYQNDLRLLRQFHRVL